MENQIRPKTWLVESILATLFCCLPFGVAGIVYAAKVDSRYNAGDFEGAMQASKEAGKWTKVSFFVGLTLAIVSIILQFVLGVALYSAGGF